MESMHSKDVYGEINLNNGIAKTLLVTITLEEYRSLVQENAQSKERIEFYEALVCKLENKTHNTAIELFFKDGETIRDEAIKEFAKMLIDKSKNGTIDVADISEYANEVINSGASDNSPDNKVVCEDYGVQVDWSKLND